MDKHCVAEDCHALVKWTSASSSNCQQSVLLHCGCAWLLTRGLSSNSLCYLDQTGEKKCLMGWYFDHVQIITWRACSWAMLSNIETSQMSSLHFLFILCRLYILELLLTHDQVVVLAKSCNASRSSKLDRWTNYDLTNEQVFSTKEFES